MGIKKSIQLSEQAVAYVQARQMSSADESSEFPSLSWSSALNGATAGLSRLLGQLVPDLDDTTWVELFNAYAGHYFGGPTIAPFRLASDVMDLYGVISIDELEPEIAAAVRQLHALSQPQQYAAYEMARVFWAQSQSLTGSLSENLAAVRAKL